MDAFQSFLGVMADSPATLPQPAADSFLYFGFGSNLSSWRVRKNNPSAEFVTIAKLSGYSLKFCGHSYNWKGATATISAEEGGEVWGVVWRIAQRHSEALDRYYDLCSAYQAPPTLMFYELRILFFLQAGGPTLQETLRRCHYSLWRDPHLYHI